MNKLIILSIFLLISAIATAQDKPRLPTRILQTTEWNWDSAITRTFTLVYINEAGVSSHLWMMTKKGRTLYIDSTNSANSFFERSDTIIVANKIFVAKPTKTNQ